MVSAMIKDISIFSRRGGPVVLAAMLGRGGGGSIMAGMGHECTLSTSRKMSTHNKM